MKLAWETVARLIEMDAVHRRGFTLKSVGPAFVLRQAEAEMSELIAAPNDPMELADLLGVLIHYAQKQGWTEEQLERLMLEKFRERFLIPNLGLRKAEAMTDGGHLSKDDALAYLAWFAAAPSVSELDKARLRHAVTIVAG